MNTKNKKNKTKKLLEELNKSKTETEIDIHCKYSVPNSPTTSLCFRFNSSVSPAVYKYLRFVFNANRIDNGIPKTKTTKQQIVK